MKNLALKIRPTASCQMDLCSTCVHYPNCSYRNLSTSSVFFCEEFRLLPELTQTVDEDQPLFTPDRIQEDPSPEKEDTSEFMGLCRNCIHRHTCIYPKPPGGVWHCEEYA